ncbi:hypothetical protein BDK51DRAFT_25561 [Blyttiomyces helicus]|uniref:DUF221-domain-containing protein n=1 Tax=Blyttiomyces helicus TaxID=388810 RepID=A0A4P9WIQ6_9FUNG|nr:hypothetical protein BDK51DRAFT_25561 [Blyttiomyces helicus]|eukprot:RKO92761.1 hypothetical protein BDK51DRAFT_25561 [Blyttiomyces helicus]
MSSTQQQPAIALPTPAATDIPTGSTKWDVSDPSLSGALVWLAIAVAVGVVAFVAYEIMRRNKGMRRILYTRVETLRAFTPPIPVGWFAWFKPAMHTPESYFVENVGIDAVMFLHFLKTSFLVFLFQTILLFPTLIPINALNDPGFSLISTNRTQDTTATFQLQIGDATLSRFSLTAVPYGSGWLWVHLLAVYASTTAWMVALLRGSEMRAGLVRARQLSVGASRTVLVRNLPEEMARSDHALQGWAASLGVGDVVGAVLDRAPGRATRAVIERRERCLRKLERACVEWVVAVDGEVRRRRLQRDGGGGIWDRWCGWWNRWRKPERMVRLLALSGEDVACGLDAETIQKLRPSRIGGPSVGAGDEEGNRAMTVSDVIEHYIVKLARLTRQVRKLRDAVELERMNADPPTPTSAVASLSGHSPEASPTSPAASITTKTTAAELPSAAFITFSTTRAAQIATQTLLHFPPPSPFTLTATAAPSPGDVLWAGVSLGGPRRALQSALATAASGLLCFFWIVPMGLVATAASIDSLRNVPAFSDAVANLEKNERVYFLIKTVGPPLVVSSCNLVIPYLLEWLSYQQGLESHTNVEKATMSKYFFFLFFNVFFVFMLSNTIWNTVVYLLENPIGVANMIAATLPLGANFFIDYIILNLILFPIQLLRPAAFILAGVGRLFVRTPREFHSLSMMTSYLNYGIAYPPHVLIHTIATVYAPISPLILLPATLYFGLGWLVYRNQLMFVYAKEWEGDGGHWGMAVRRCCLGMGVGQFTMLGLLAAKGAGTQSILLLPLILATLIFSLYINVRYDVHATHIPLDIIPIMDTPAVLEKDDGQPGSNAEAVVVTAKTGLVTSAEEHLDDGGTAGHGYRNPESWKPMHRAWVPVAVGEWLEAGGRRKRDAEEGPEKAEMVEVGGGLGGWGRWTVSDGASEDV